jgi:FtsH-binding integral membrane protein
MVNSALYEKLFGGSRSHKGSGSGSGRNSGFHHFNLNMMTGGKRRGAKGGADSSSFLKLLNEKKEFLLAVFANLITQLGITYYIMMNYKGDDKKTGMFWGLFVVEILIIIVLALVPMPVWLKFILFSLFSACSGIMLSFMKRMVDPKLIQMAILGTMSIFGLMFLFGAMLIMFGINLGFQFAAFLFYALLLLIIVQLVVMFSGTSSMFIKGLSVAGLVLFSLYIIYDTNHILQREYYGDFITASLDYYLDILNIFIDLVSFNSN